MGTFNKVTLVGYVGKIESKVVNTTTGAQTAVTFTIATDEYDAKSENKKKTEWHNITAFGKIAEVASRYVKKGSFILVDGKLRTRDWVDAKTNEKKYKTEIAADSLVFLDRKGQGQDEGYTQQAPSYSNAVANPFNVAEAQVAAYDDDMPF